MILEEYKVNEYISVKVEEVDEEDWRSGPGGKDYLVGYNQIIRTSIYVNDKWMKPWKYGDDVLEKYYPFDTYEKLCIDLDQWYKTDYKSSLLPPPLAYQLLKELVEVNDPLALRVFEQEVIGGLNEGDQETKTFLEEWGYRNLLGRQNFWQELKIDTTILQDLEKLTKKKLNILESIYSRDQFKPFAGFVIKNDKISALLLEDCNLEEFPEKITNLIGLEYLSLENNQIEQLPGSITNLKKLKEFRISNNRFHEFPNILFKVSSLEKLWMVGNNLNEISNEIIVMKSLTHFSFGGNEVIAFPEALCHMKHIRSLGVGGPIEILPPSIEFLFEGRESRNNLSLSSSHFWTAYRAWKESFERNKKLCSKCREKYHSDNFSMCYNCLIKYEENFRQEPLKFTKSLKSFNYKEWLERGCPEKIYEEKIEASKQSNGIFSYFKEVRNLVSVFEREGYSYTFENVKNPRILPLLRKAIFNTDDKWLLVDYGPYSSPYRVERYLRQAFNKIIEYNTRDGTFFQNCFFDEIKRKVENNYFPELTTVLKSWFTKYTLKRAMSKSLPSLNEKLLGSWNVEEITGNYKASYGIIDNFYVVNCTFERRGPTTLGYFTWYPKNYISYENSYGDIESDEYPGLEFPVTYLRNIVFISNIEVDKGKSDEMLTNQLKTEINDIAEYVVQPRVSDSNYKWRFTTLDEMSDYNFIRIILFEELYQKEFLYAILSQFDSYDSIQIQKKTLNEIENIVPTDIQEKLIEELKRDFRFTR
jgi:Leucine-rich repeat (LRR) protein